MSNISHAIQKKSGNSEWHCKPWAWSPKPITGNVRCWLWACLESWDREQEGHQNQGFIYGSDCFKCNAQAVLNLKWNFIFFFFFFLLLPPPHLPYRKFIYSEMFCSSASVKGNIQGSQKLVLRQLWKTRAISFHRNLQDGVWRKNDSLAGQRTSLYLYKMSLIPLPLFFYAAVRHYIHLKNPQALIRSTGNLKALL